MSVCFVLLLNIFIAAKISALEDLTAAAITVYRNPDFFRHLSHEFNDHLLHFDKDAPYYQRPRDEYKSPSEDESYSYSYGGNDPYKQIDNFYKQHNGYHDDTQSYQDDGDDHRNEEKNYNEEDDEPAPYKESANEDDEDSKEEQNEEEEEDDDKEQYKYPGETTKPNQRGHPNVNVHYDNGKDFRPPPREVPIPKKPTNRGRGPYGHPRYGQEYKKDESQSDEDASEENINQNQQKPKYIKPSLQQLQVYHQGKRYPLHGGAASETQDYVNGYHDYKHHPQLQHHYEDDYGSIEHLSLPQHNEEYDHTVGTKIIGPEKFEEFKETKKGTREYLKHNRVPSSPISNNYKKPVTVINCETQVKPKKPRKYLKYRVQPIYSHYRIVPFYHNHLNYKRYAPVYGRNIRYFPFPRKPNVIRKGNAFVIESKDDPDYENIRRRLGYN